MAAVSRVCPLPLVRESFVPVRKKYNYIRMRDMLASALRPGGAAGGDLFGRGAALGMDISGGGVGSEVGGDGDVVMGGMGVVGGQPMMRGGGGSSRGLFGGIGGGQKQSISA